MKSSPDTPTTGNLITLAGLCRSYREGEQLRPVIDGLDAGFRRGEYVALVGRSGSGKSTLLNLISGIDLPDAGSIKIADTSLTQLDERQRTLFRRRHIGFIYQFFNLIPTLTVEENVLLPLELNGYATDEARSRVAEALDEISLADRSDTFPDRLSGGEQQRVAIARATVHKPLLVLADEPTGNLDADTSELILQLLSRLVADDTTLIVATHSERVTQEAHRALTLGSGKLTHLTREPE